MPSFQPSRGRDTRLLRHWPQLWALLLTAPAALAVTSMSMKMAAAALVVGFALPTVTALAMTVDNARELRVKLPAAIRFGACGAATGLGLGGLFAFSGSLAWAAVAAYAATATWAHVSRSTTRARAAESPHDRSEPATGLRLVTTDEVPCMSDSELCRAWRQSFVTLTSTSSVDRRARVVSLRQVLLDEMEVRHPDGLQAWLHSGARAADGPDRYFGHGDCDGAAPAA